MSLISEKRAAAQAAKTAVVEKLNSDPIDEIIQKYGLSFFRGAAKVHKEKRPPGRPKKGAKAGKSKAAEEAASLLEMPSKGAILGLNEAHWTERFLLRHSIICDPVERAWFSFEGRIWEQRSYAEIQSMVIDYISKTCACEGHQARVLEDKDSEFADANTQTIARLASTGVAENIAKRLAGHRAVVRRDPFAKRPLGVLTLKNGRLQIHEDGQVSFEPGAVARPEDLATDVLPIDFNPKARARRLRAWLRRIFKGRRGDVQAIAKTFGSVVWGEQPWKKMLLVRGESGRGKSQFGLIAGRLAGRGRVADFDPAQLGSRFEASSFVGKSVLRAPEVAGDFLMSKAGSILKSMCGGDPLPTRKHYTADAPEQLGTKTVIATTDQKLSLRADVDRPSWKARLVLLEADGPAVALRDQMSTTGFVSALFDDAEEASGILNFAIAGLRQILRAGKGRGGQWGLSVLQEERLDILFDEGESVSRWVQERLGCVTGGKGGLSTNVAYEDYFKWAQKHAITPWKFNTFSKLAKDAVAQIFGATCRKDIPSAEAGGSVVWGGFFLKGTEVPEVQLPEGAGE